MQWTKNRWKWKQLCLHQYENLRMKVKQLKTLSTIELKSKAAVYSDSHTKAVSLHTRQGSSTDNLSCMYSSIGNYNKMAPVWCKTFITVSRRDRGKNCWKSLIYHLSVTVAHSRSKGTNIVSPLAKWSRKPPASLVELQLYFSAFGDHTSCCCCVNSLIPVA